MGKEQQKIWGGLARDSARAWETTGRPAGARPKDVPSNAKLQRMAAKFDPHTSPSQRRIKIRDDAAYRDMLIAKHAEHRAGMKQKYDPQAKR